MKKTNIILSFVICILLYGCTDLSETVYTGVAMNDFFKNEKELVAATTKSIRLDRYLLR